MIGLYEAVCFIQSNMSGRPAYPAWVIPTFSTDANYPAGANPWSGQPTRVVYPGAAGGFVPNQPNAAQYFNYLYNQGFGIDQSAQTFLTSMLDFLGQSQALNFEYKGTTALLNGGGFNEPPIEMSWPIFDPIGNRWVMVGRTIHAGCLGWISYNGGGGIESGNAFYNPTGVFDGGLDYAMAGAVNPTTGLIVFLKKSGTSTSSLPTESFTWTANTLGSGTGGDAMFGDVRWFPPANKFVVISEQSSNATMYKGDGVTAWTDISSLIPSGLVAIPAGQSRHNWHCANSPTRMVALEENSTSYFTTDDAVTSTSRTLAAGIIATSNQVILTVTYATSLSLFYMVVYDKVALGFKCYSSADAISWSLQSSPATQVHPHAIGSVGTMLVMYGTKFPAGLSRSKFFISVDGATTWRETDGQGQAITAFCNAKIHTDGQRILMNTEDHYFRSAFSAGMPNTI